FPGHEVNLPLEELLLGGKVLPQEPRVGDERGRGLGSRGGQVPRAESKMETGIARHNSLLRFMPSRSSGITTRPRDQFPLISKFVMLVVLSTGRESSREKNRWGQLFRRPARKKSLAARSSKDT